MGPLDRGCHEAQRTESELQNQTSKWTYVPHLEKPSPFRETTGRHLSNCSFSLDQGLNGPSPRCHIFAAMFVYRSLRKRFSANIQANWPQGLTTRIEAESLVSFNMTDNSTCVVHNAVQRQLISRIRKICCNDGDGKCKVLEHNGNSFVKLFTTSFVQALPPSINALTRTPAWKTLSPSESERTDNRDSKSEVVSGGQSHAIPSQCNAVIHASRVAYEWFQVDIRLSPMEATGRSRTEVIKMMSRAATISLCLGH